MRFSQTLIKAGSPIHTLILKRSTGDDRVKVNGNNAEIWTAHVNDSVVKKAILASVLPPIIHLQHRCGGFEDRRQWRWKKQSKQTCVVQALILGAE